MFKKKFLELAKSQENNGTFEVLNESQTLSIMGGQCDLLKRCVRFGSKCPGLNPCGIFVEHDQHHQ